MKKLKDGPADLKLSTAARDKYVKLIREFQEDLQAERNWMNGKVDDLGDPGQFQSAIQTRANLLKDVNGPNSLKHKIDDHIEYCHLLEAGVTKAATHLIKSG